jgi:hypothetical protein
MLTFDSLQALRLERCDRDHTDGRPPDGALIWLSAKASGPTGQGQATAEAAQRFAHQGHKRASTRQRIQPTSPVKAGHPTGAKPLNLQP